MTSTASTTRKTAASKSVAKRPARKTAPRPAAVPQDRKPKSSTVEVDGVRILQIEVRGITVTLNGHDLDDWDIMDGLNRGNFFPLFEKFSEADQAALRNLIQHDDGRVKMSEMIGLLTDVLQAARPN